MLTWLVLYFSLEAGVNNSSFALYTPDVESFNVLKEIEFYQDVKMTATMFKYFYISADILVFEYKDLENAYFFPTRIDSIIEFGIKYENISFAFRHLCFHPITPYLALYSDVPNNEGGTNQFFLRLELGKK